MPVIEVPGIGNVHFPDGMKDAEMATAIDGLLAQQTQAGGQLPTTASHNPAEALPIASPSATPAPARKPVTAGQVLAEENRPLSAGLGTMAGEAMQGMGEIADPKLGPLSTIMGLLRGVNAPSAGAGSAVGTTVHNVLGNTPGLGGPAGIIPTAGAALADAGTQLVTGPGAIKGLINAAKAGTRGATALLAPDVLRRAGTEAVAEKMGAPATVLERAFTTPASKAAYTMAEKSGQVKNTDDLADVVQGAFFRHGDLANPSQKALDHLSNVEKKFRGATRGMPYSEVMREVQALKHKADDALRGATPDGDLANTLLEAREYLIESLDKVSPMYRQANRLYRQEQATIDVMNAVRAGTPGTSLDKFIENNRDVIKAFSPAAVKEISAIANRLNTVASSVPAGGYRQTFSALMEMIGAHGLIASETGRAIIRKALSNTPDKIPAALSASIQLWRAGNSATSDY
jgi:hypothetical protein